MTQPIILERRDRIGLLRIDNPPVNAISRAVVQGLADALARIAGDATLDALIVYCAGTTFVAGGDIREFDRPDFSARPFNALLAQLEALPITVTAALHGTVLGGGLELALACHFRVAAPKTRIGFPEVKLGILPGSLGTQRLPRIAGPKLALDMILSGRPIDADSAVKSGVVDAIVDGDLLDAAVAFARSLVANRTAPRRTSALTVRMDAITPDFFANALAEVTAKSSAYPAPPRIVRCIEAAATLPFGEGEAIEARAFEECRKSPESEAMRHLFFAEREAGRIPGLPGGLKSRAIDKVGVVGAGTMGGGIAMACINAGIPTVLVEQGQDALDRGLGGVRKTYQASVARGRLRPEDVDRRMAALTGSTDYAAFADCDLVIEAVYENLDLKQRVAAQLGRVCKAGAIIATNTSTLDVDVLAQASLRPADCLGLHFFSPANVMRLLEVVRGAATAPEVLVTVMPFARRIAKTPVVSGVCYGFIGNRMLEPYLRETEFLLLEGASPAQIDGAIQALGMVMGPCRMLDLAGIDVAAKVVIERGKAGGLPRDPAYRAVVLKLFELGRHGQKTGAGYYRYDGRAHLPDDATARICAELARAHGVARRTDITDQEIIERCLYPLIAEGARILEEGIAARPGDIDIVWTHGFGFPDYRGGPIFMADRIGLAQIVARLAHYAQTRGDAHGYWTTPRLLVDTARAGKRLSDLAR